MNVIPLKPQKSVHDFEMDGFKFELTLHPTSNGGCLAQYAMIEPCPEESTPLEEMVHVQIVAKQSVKLEWWDRLFGMTLESKILTVVQVMRRQIEMAMFAQRKIREIREKIEK